MAAERRSFWWDGERFSLPIFTGHDPERWIFEMERYFWIFRLTEEEEVDLAIDCFEEFAMDWYQWESRAPFYSWGELKRTLLDKFSYSRNGIHYDKLSMRQREEYVELFRSKYCPTEINDTAVDPTKERDNKVKEGEKPSKIITSNLNIGGLLKAENEVIVFKQPFRSAIKQESALKDQVSHLDESMGKDRNDEFLINKKPTLDLDSGEKELEPYKMEENGAQEEQDGQGQTLTNVAENLDVQYAYAAALNKLGHELEEIVDKEKEATLSNGGIERLALGFIDSMATLNLSEWAYGLRCNYDLFKHQLLLCSATIANLIFRFKEKEQGSWLWSKFPNKFVVQPSDTHPTLAISNSQLCGRERLPMTLEVTEKMNDLHLRHPTIVPQDYVFDRGKLKTQLPLSNLEDKVVFRAGGNVTPTLLWRRGIG